MTNSNEIDEIDNFEALALITVVMRLRPVFEKHFKLKPTSDPKGPFIAFVRQTLIELKYHTKPFSRRLLSATFLEDENA